MLAGQPNVATRQQSGQGRVHLSFESPLGTVLYPWYSSSGSPHWSGLELAAWLARWLMAGWRRELQRTPPASLVPLACFAPVLI